jgi:hypothetical protein
VTAPADITVAAGSGCTAAVSDAQLGQATFTDNCPSRVSLVRGAVPGGNVFPLGETLVAYTATDSGGLIHTVYQKVEVVDATPPVVSQVAASTNVLSPANHQMETVTISYSTSDNCGTVTPSLVVTSNEPENGTGDGDTAPDWVVVDAHTVRLRAERAGTGTGRVYTITVVGVDGIGNASSGSVTVTVPHNPQ